MLLSQNAGGGSTVYHQNNSCESTDMNSSPTDDSQQHSLHHSVVHSHSGAKYASESQNGHDTYQDFVTYVCQETATSSQGHHSSESDMSRTPKSQYSQYSTMLPPPPLPPMARPVAIIRSTGDLTMVSSAPSSNMTPPQSMSSPGHHPSDHDSGSNGGNGGTIDLNQSPPLSPQSQMDIGRKPLTRIPSPYSIGREYSFNHFQAQPTQVCQAKS